MNDACLVTCNESRAFWKEDINSAFQELSGKLKAIPTCNICYPQQFFITICNIIIIFNCIPTYSKPYLHALWVVSTIRHLNTIINTTYYRTKFFISLTRAPSTNRKHLDPLIKSLSPRNVRTDDSTISRTRVNILMRRVGEYWALTSGRDPNESARIVCRFPSGPTSRANKTIPWRLVSDDFFAGRARRGSLIVYECAKGRYNEWYRHSSGRSCIKVPIVNSSRSWTPGGLVERQRPILDHN